MLTRHQHSTLDPRRIPRPFREIVEKTVALAVGETI